MWCHDVPGVNEHWLKPEEFLGPLQIQDVEAKASLATCPDIFPTATPGAAGQRASPEPPAPPPATALVRPTGRKIGGGLRVAVSLQKFLAFLDRRVYRCNGYRLHRIDMVCFILFVLYRRMWRCHCALRGFCQHLMPSQCTDAASYLHLFAFFKFVSRVKTLHGIFPTNMFLHGGIYLFFWFDCEELFSHMKNT